MIARIKELKATAPFRPFVVVSSGGRRYRVASAGHVSIHPRGGQAMVWLDDGGGISLAAGHIAAVEESASEDATA